jgi:hypothetical protein
MVQLGDKWNYGHRFAPRVFCFVAQGSHTPVFNKREELSRCGYWYACQYLTEQSIPTCILVLKKKPMPNSILFIDASQ